MILELSEQYRIAPWELEERCTPYWWHRMIARYRIMAEKRG
jgi:hypothetical protein